jgi:hypothetical protein
MVPAQDTTTLIRTYKNTAPVILISIIEKSCWPMAILINQEQQQKVEQMYVRLQLHPSHTNVVCGSEVKEHRHVPSSLEVQQIDVTSKKH